MALRDDPFIRQLPNVLTTLRLLAVPLFVALMIAGGGPNLAAGLVFFVAAFTDFFDGFLARRLHVMSQYGKIVDPLADRLLVNSAAILLCIYDAQWFGGDGRLWGPECLIIVARDVFALVGYWRVRALVIPEVPFLGKVGMAWMMFGLTWLLLLPEATWPVWFFEAGLIVSVVVMIQYVRTYRGAFETARERGSVGTSRVTTAQALVDGAAPSDTSNPHGEIDTHVE